MKKYLLILFSSILLFSCEKDVEVVPTTNFDFAHEFYAVNEQVQIIDVNNADAYRWDFGYGTT